MGCKGPGRGDERTQLEWREVQPDPGQPVTQVRTLDAILRDDEFATPRFNVILLSIFAAAGFLLAVVGVYGVMSSAVAQERQEIGIRMALGATAGSVAAGRMLAQQVWRVSAFDPLAFTIVSGLLLTAGLMACAWPALRAARIDPITGLRQE